MPSDAPFSLPRINDGWLSCPEQRAIAWAAPRMPTWTSPDQLTVLGLAAATTACASYILAAQHPAWLWLVNGALLVNWFADSLDGAIARIRSIERPRYGFFLDQSVDVVSQLLFAIGLGLSGFVRIEIVAVGLATYFMMSIQCLLRAEVRRVFHLSSGGMGLTEVRCLFVVVNALFYFVPSVPFKIGNSSFVYGDALGCVWIFANLAAYLRTMIGELQSIGREEPSSQPGSAIK